MELRIAKPKDAPAITTVINTAFRHAESFFIERNRIDLETVQELMQKGQFLLAEKKNILAGCVYVELREKRSYLGLLSVDPEIQKGGLGSKLMNAAEEHCRSAGSQFMDLQIVNVREELPDFYHHRGYRETGTTPMTPGLNPKIPCHFVKMSKPLA